MTRITEAAVLYEDEAYTGYRHRQALDALVKAKGKKDIVWSEVVQGFMTSKGTFVDRFEAACIALASGQVEKLSRPRWGLFSEDLY